MKRIIRGMLIEKKNVCMIVWNEFLHDARVTKEAETLFKAGYAVTVLALHTPGKTLRKDRHPAGFTVIRVPFLIRIIWHALKKLLQHNKAGVKNRRQPNTIAKAENNQSPLKSNFQRTLLSALAIPAKFMTHCALLIAAFRAKADICHAHDFNVLLTTWLAAKLTSASIVYDAHEISTDREGYNISGAFIRKIERFLVHKVNAMITTNETRGKIFQEDYQIQMPVVLQNRSKYMLPKNSRKLRTVLKLNDCMPIVLYQGGIQKGRGMRILIEVAERVENTYFVYLGSGKLDQIIKDMVIEKQLERRVFMVPMVPLIDLPTYTASADIGVQLVRNTCLNHYSTESNKLFEYLMAGLPVIVSDFPEMRRIVEEYHVGLTVNPDDIDDITGAIKKMISSPDLYQQYRRNALDSAKSLCWEEQEHRLVDLYRNLK